MKLQRSRLISQVVLFFTANLGALGIKTGLCYPFFYCHACPTASAACPLRALEQSVYKGSFTWRFFVYPLLIISFLGILTGRAVCAWACPIGLLQRGTGTAARKLKQYPQLQTLRLRKLDKYLRYTKYVVLIGTVFLSSWFFGLYFTDVCPVGFLTGTIPVLILNPGLFVPNAFFFVALIILILFLILIVVVERGWCRYFCPVGALLAPFNKISFLYVSVNTAECGGCNKCSDVCPMGIDVAAMNRDPECILCGKCISACPKKIISFKRV